LEQLAAKRYKAQSGDELSIAIIELIEEGFKNLS
jgi:hypothetical protein